jgi:HlyD family secretion protein
VTALSPTHETARRLLDRRLPPLARSVFYPAAALIAAGLAWSSLAVLDRVVVANGRIVTTERPMVLQPFERGVVRSIEVEPGQRVARGQVLATLDPTLVETAEQELANRHALLLAQVSRLWAENEGRAFVAADDASAATWMEARLSSQRIAEFEARIAAQLAAERRVAARQASLQGQLRALDGRLAIAREVEAMRQELRVRDAGSRLTLLQAQAERLTLEEQAATLRTELEDQARQSETLAAEHAGFAHRWRKETAERLIEAQRELDAATQQLVAARRRRELIVLRAPADGVVLEVARRSAGSVVQEAETLITLVPAEGRLEAEVEIGPEDAGHVATGAPVRVKLGALSFQRHGVMAGEVRVVNADALPAGGAPGRLVHRARVSVDAETLRAVPAGFRLSPGMEVSAEVKVGRRAVIGYVLDPILKIGDEALRER